MRSALVASHRDPLNRKNVVFCVGNGFIRSETSVNIHGSLNGEWSVHTLGNGLAHSVGEAAFADVFIMNLAGYSDHLPLCQISGWGNSASRSERINPFPTKRINIFPFNVPAQNHYSHGMHKCIPYESFVNKSIIMLIKTDMHIKKFVLDIFRKLGIIRPFQM